MNAEVQRIFNEAQRQGQQTRDQGGIDIDLEERLLAPEVIERRRQHLVRMLRRGREARQQQREAVSSSDEERDLRRVEAQLHGMTAEFQAIFNQIFKRRDRAQNKDLERAFLDPDGVEKRRKHLMLMLKQNRNARQQRGEEVSSSDDERDLRRIQMQMQGLTTEFQQVFNRIRLSFKSDERTQRREDGVAVSSSDEERSVRWVDVQLEGISSQGGLLAAHKKNRRRRREERQRQTQQQQDLEGTMFHRSANKARLSLYNQRALLSLDSEMQTTSHTELFRVKGISTNFKASSHSYDAKILEQIAQQKELLQAAGYMAFQSENGQEELQAVAAKTKKMRNFWTSFSLSRADMKPGNSVSLRKCGTSGSIEAEFVVGSGENLRRDMSKSSEQLHVHGTVRGLDRIESAALVASSKKMRKFWQAVDAKSKENSPDRRVLLHNCPDSDEEVRKCGVLLGPSKAAIARASVGCRVLLFSPDCNSVNHIRDFHASGA